MSSSDEHDEADEEDYWLPPDPAVRAGAYQSIDEVPDHQRLRVYAREFESRDCWQEFVGSKSLLSDERSEYRRNHVRRAEERWKAFIEERGRHHALCTPADAERYATYVQEEYSISPVTASEYWATVEQFYRWMFWHAEYPHRYHPFLMAAANYDASLDLWLRAIRSK